MLFATNANAPKTSQLKLCREIIAVRSEIYTKHKNALCRQNVEYLNVEPDGTYSDHRALKGWGKVKVQMLTCVGSRKF